MNRSWYKNVFKILLILFVVSIPLSFVINKVTEPESMSYNDFVQELNKGSVSAIKYYPLDDDMIVYFHNDESRNLNVEERQELNIYEKEDKRLVLYPNTDNFIEDMLIKDVALVNGRTSSNLLDILGDLLFLWIFLGLILFLYDLCTTQVKQFSFGDLGSDILVESKNITTKYSDIIGHDEAIHELSYLTELIKNPSLGKSLKAEMPHGILFIGPPGTGKTLVARAMAGECSTHFIYMNASAFVEQFVGTGAKRVRQLFKEARKYPSCIIFIDELDAVGASRDNEMSNSEYRQTLNALLQEMDGFSKQSNVIVIGATNHPEILSKALTRAGRFDRQITFNPPSNYKTRLDLLNYYFSGRPQADDVNLVSLSKELIEFTGADISTIANNSSLIALQKKHNQIFMEDIQEAIDKMILKGSYKESDKEAKKFRLVCYHEAGHAVMCYLLGVPIIRICVKPSTSGVGGFVAHNENEEEYLMTKNSLINNIKILYGGRVSEAIKFGNDCITIGASNDIEKATDLIKQYSMLLGFSDKGAVINWESISRNLIDQSVIDDIVSISNDLYESTVNLLKENYNLVEILVKQLMITDTIYGEDVIELLKTQQVANTV